MRITVRSGHTKLFLPIPLALEAPMHAETQIKKSALPVLLLFSFFPGPTVQPHL